MNETANHHNDELWAHDTSNLSTWQVADINSGGNSKPGEYMAILVGDTLYSVRRMMSDRTELWAHDTSNHSTWEVDNLSLGVVIPRSTCQS